MEAESHSTLCPLFFIYYNFVVYYYIMSIKQYLMIKVAGSIPGIYQDPNSNQPQSPIQQSTQSLGQQATNYVAPDRYKKKFYVSSPNVPSSAGDLALKHVLSNSPNNLDLSINNSNFDEWNSSIVPTSFNIGLNNSWGSPTGSTKVLDTTLPNIYRYSNIAKHILGYNEGIDTQDKFNAIGTRPSYNNIFVPSGASNRSEDIPGVHLKGSSNIGTAGHELSHALRGIKGVTNRSSVNNAVDDEMATTDQFFNKAKYVLKDKPWLYQELEDTYKPELYSALSTYISLSPDKHTANRYRDVLDYLTTVPEYKELSVNPYETTGLTQDISKSYDNTVANIAHNMINNSTERRQANSRLLGKLENELAPKGLDTTNNWWNKGYTLNDVAAKSNPATEDFYRSWDAANKSKAFNTEPSTLIKESPLFELK